MISTPNVLNFRHYKSFCHHLLTKICTTITKNLLNSYRYKITTIQRSTSFVTDYSIKAKEGLQRLNPADIEEEKSQYEPKQ